MAIIENSFIFRLFCAVWAALEEEWKGSFLYGVFRKIGAAIRRGAAGSVLCQAAWREGNIPRAWSESQACRLLTGLVNLPCALTKTIYKAGKNLWDGSVFFRLLTRLGGLGAPLVGLCAFVMLVAPHAMWNNVYALLLVLAVTALYILGTANSRRRLELERIGPYHVIFFAFLCIALVSSVSLSLSLRFFLFHLTGLLMVLVLVSATQRVEQVQAAVAVAAAGLFVASLYGCYQGYIGVPVIASQQDMTVNPDMPGRVYSFFDNPNNFAELLVMLLPLLLALFLNAKSWKGKGAAVIAFGVGLAAIGYTLSRSGWLGLILAVFVFLALQNWRVVPFAMAAALVALPFLPQSIYNRFLTIGNMQDSSTRYRFAIYEATGNLMKDYWFQGVGLGSDVMTKVFQSYPTMYDGNHPIHTHNNYLQMWGELGLAGGVAYIVLVLSQVKNGVKAYYAAGNRRVRNLLSASVGAFCGILLISVAEYTWFYPRNMFLFWFLFAIIGACVKLVKKEGDQKG